MNPARNRQERIRDILDTLAETSGEKDLSMDPLEWVRRYPDRRDQEVAGFIAALLALGRYDCIRDAVQRILLPMGDSPFRFVGEFDPGRMPLPFEGFGYRFYKERDIGLMIQWIAHMLETSGSIENFFLQGYRKEDPHIGPALGRFVRRLRMRPCEPYYSSLSGHGAAHFLTDPAGKSACKRLCLFLRWMIRKDYPDTGLWASIPASKLVIPLDTHIFRLSRCLGFTNRAVPGWNTALEITGSLRRFDPDDPVRYDFSLCTLGKKQACPAIPSSESCSGCALVEVCLLSADHTGVFNTAVEWSGRAS